MVVLDAGILIKLFSQRAPTEDRQKLVYLVDTLQKTRERIAIPTPALSEYLVKAGKATEGILEQIRKSAVFRVVSFDQRAAIECALAIKRALDHGDKKSGSTSTWAKVKFDWQIVAIAKVANASRIYTEDSDVKRYAAMVGIAVSSVSDLQLPPDAKQGKLDLMPPNE